MLTHLTYELTVTDHFVMICQMTGLDPDNDLILEIYCLITDGQLNLLDDEGWGTIVHQSKARMDVMDDWCTRVRRFSCHQRTWKHTSDF